MRYIWYTLAIIFLIVDWRLTVGILTMEFAARILIDAWGV
jgi:hypothetical protein